MAIRHELKLKVMRTLHLEVVRLCGWALGDVQKDLLWRRDARRLLSHAKQTSKPNRSNERNSTQGIHQTNKTAIKNTPAVIKSSTVR
jgi:hypothetical protein